MPGPMATKTVTERASSEQRPRNRLDRVLEHPLAFLATALILLALIGGTFVANPDRVAPTKDPAYYTWHTEMLISERPVKVIETKGPFDMFAGGYRVAAWIAGGYLRHLPGLSSLNATSLLMVVVPVGTALLLAGFAYRHRRDPLLWHLVAFGAASLYLTPPFVGYLDNVLCLFFLAAAIWFIGPARSSWGARAGLFLFVLLSGFTHPTTVVFFCLTLGLMAVVRLLWRRFDVRSVIRDDGPALASAFLAGIVFVATWAVGIWGEPASLGEAALPPPYDSDFFVERMTGWLEAMRPALNGPLLLVGIVGLLATGRRWVEDDLARTTIVWLAPLAGSFGFLAGLAYPYYRFFNTTLAWVLLVGVGAWFLLRTLLDRSRDDRVYAIAAGVVALGVAFVFATNFMSGFDQSGWNDPTKGWISAQTRASLDVLRRTLTSEDEDRPVVFVIDDETPTFQIWGFTKLSGNTSRYALPHGQVDQAYLYLGSLENYLAGEPTLRDEATYDKLSPALLEDAEEGVERSGERPIVVVAEAFNLTGSNAELAAGVASPPDVGDADVWLLNDEGLEILGSGPAALGDDLRLEVVGGEWVHLVRVVTGFLLVLLPGALALRFFVPDATMAEAVGMVPALSLGLLTVVAMVVLVVAPSFSLPVALLCLGIASAAGLSLRMARGRGASAGARLPARS